MEDCIFCKIAKGETPCYKVYEDEKVIAFLNINPFALGHTLLIPKEHSKWIWDIDDENYKYLMVKVKVIAKAMQKAFNTEWVVEGVAGIDVPHSHIHIIPRNIGDGQGAFPNMVLDPKPTEEEMAKVAERIKDNI